LKESLSRKKTDELDISTSVTIDRQEDAQARIQALQRAINTARGKREMVKGVLRVSSGNCHCEDKLLTFIHFNIFRDSYSNQAWIGQRIRVYEN
jgi:hypothetical protein